MKAPREAIYEIVQDTTKALLAPISRGMAYRESIASTRLAKQASIP